MNYCFLPGTSGSGFLFDVGFGFDPPVVPVAAPLVDGADEPPGAIVPEFLSAGTPLAGTSLSVFVVEPGLLAPEDGACAETAPTESRSAAAAIAEMVFI